MSRLFTRVLSLVVAVAGIVVPVAAQVHSHPPAVAGKWTMTVEAGPHGTTTMGLVLQQEGKAVTGSFASPHGDLPVAGEFVDATLTLATSGANGPAITFNAKLKDNGTLAGYLSSEMGDMTWTAARVKDAK